MEHDLPINLLYWSAALLPLVLLLIMLVGFKWSAPVSGGISLAAALLIAFFMYESGWESMLTGLGKGAWDAFFILLVVWPALLLYHIAKEAKGFQAIREGIQDYSQNYLFLVLALGWVFASFIQGIAGFGAPIAVVAPLLAGIGVKPIMAVAIALIGHSWANMFGTLGVSWIATKNVVNIEDPSLTTLYTAILLWIVNLVGGFVICWLFAKWKGIKEGFWAVLIISAIHGGGQLALTQINPTLSAFVPASVALGALYLLSKWKKYSDESSLESEIMQDRDEDKEEKANMSLNTAFMPYYVLAGLSIGLLAVPFINEFLNKFEFGIPFPEVSTGYNYETEGAESYSPITPLTHPGTFLLITSVFAYLWFKSKDRYKEGTLQKILKSTAGKAIGSSLAITAFLTMTQVMSHSGQTTVLALGIAEVSSPAVYMGLANLIGILGAFMTSSNTASNVLFSPLHSSVVQTMDKLSLSHVIAAQSAGAALGNAVAPANVVLGTSTTDTKGSNAAVLKITIVYCLIAGLLISAASLFIYWFLPG